jgi:Ca2+-transporting ATPase
MRKFEEYGVRGLRMVGFAMRRRKKGERKLTRKSVKSGLTWIGIVVHEDPVREGVKEALFEVKKAGITVKVITGDHRATAEAVLEQLGLLTKKDKLSARFPLVMEGSELETLSSDELRGRVRETVLFSRIDPVQKLSIVEALQASGEVVAMTGDGVNDAPALKRADVGIVVSGATDVAKETADMVLLDDNFATIAAAVEEGRGIFENLRKVILYLLSDSFSEVTLVMGSLLLGLPLPLTAAQILWINIISDGFPNLALTVEPKEGDLMQQKPRDLREALVNSEIKLLILLISAVTGIVTLIAFYWFWRNSGDVHSARTIAFSMLGVNSLIYVFSARSLRQPLWQTKIFSNPWLLLAVLGGFFFQLTALYTPVFQRLLATRPLTPLEWLLVILQAFLVIGMIESVKWIFLQKRRLREQWDRVLY